MTELKMCELEVIDGGEALTAAVVAGTVLVGTGLIQAGYSFGKWCQGAWNKFF